LWIGWTQTHSHDDITYKSVAKAFDLPLVLHEEAYARMKKLYKQRQEQPPFSWDEDSPARRARLRMVELPTDPKIPVAKQALFPCEDQFVPVAVVNGNLHILPGVPVLCKWAPKQAATGEVLRLNAVDKLLYGLTPSILSRLGQPLFRASISTPLPESAIADYLTTLASRLERRGINVGSYPQIGKDAKNTVTLVGKYAPKRPFRNAADGHAEMLNISGASP
jgi:molybdopterin-biosynthesis enzyme MoeA-like protein